MYKPKRKRHFLFSIAVFVIVTIACAQIVYDQQKLSGLEDSLESLKDACAQQTIENEELQRLLSENDLDEYYEKIAREQLGYVRSDEQVFVDIGGK